MVLKSIGVEQKFGTMKKMILMIMAIGGLNLGAQAQQNRTYRTDMQNGRIYEEERRGGGRDMERTTVRLNTGSNNQENPDLINNDVLSINSVNEFQGYSTAADRNVQVNHQQGRSGDVQENIRRNTVMYNLGPQRGAQMLNRQHVVSVNANAMEQFNGNRSAAAKSKSGGSKTSLATKGKTKTGTTLNSNRSLLNSNLNNNSFRIETTGEFTGNRIFNTTPGTGVQTVFEVGTADPGTVNNMIPQYDTSKNNGHCLGCGSGTLTDSHDWMNR